MLDIVPDRGFVLVDMDTETGRELALRYNAPMKRMAVQYQWVDLCVAARRLVAPTLRHEPVFVRHDRAPMRVLVCNDFSPDVAKSLRARVRDYGGTCDDKVTEENADVVVAGASFHTLKQRGRPVVRPSWVADCIERNHASLPRDDSPFEHVEDITNVIWDILEPPRRAGRSTRNKCVPKRSSCLAF